jgi:hypothetical protein
MLEVTVRFSTAEHPGIEHSAVGVTSCDEVFHVDSSDKLLVKVGPWEDQGLDLGVVFFRVGKTLIVVVEKDMG